MSNTADIIADMCQYRYGLLMCMGTPEGPVQVANVAFEIVRTTAFIENATYNLYLDPEYCIDSKPVEIVGLSAAAVSRASSASAASTTGANGHASRASATNKKLAKLKKHLK